MAYYAHTGKKNDKSDWQDLASHLKAVASLAQQFAAPLGLGNAAYIAGLLHDLGKYNPDFQRKLEGVEKAVDHSTAGGKVLLEKAGSPNFLMAKLIAHAILGHHAGLPDTVNSTDGSLAERIRRPIRIHPDFETEIGFDLSTIEPELDPSIWRSKAPGFALSFIGRMLFSCLVDADFKDTEAYYSSIGEREADRSWPQLKDLLPEFQARFEAKISSFGRPEEDIQQWRAHILDEVLQRAGKEPGLFTLTVPTGGGKTLASLGFALTHAQEYAKQRIIYAIPFTSIIDQTVAVFEEVLGEEHVLAHHSAIDEEGSTSSASREQRDKLKLAMEDWAAPVVVTTNVQFFESLFSARPSRSRKLHNIANSVIILDEAQTIPRPYLIPCMRALEELTSRFGCTVVLCTATQPALGKRPRFEHGLPLAGRELAPEPEFLARQFARTKIVHGGEMENAALIEAMRQHPQSLVIVNSRRHALELFQEADAADLEGLVHLTTRQYAAHRKRILQDIRERLAEKRPCRLVATSLIEAGVDVDFPIGWRAEAGLDQIIQAAGRVNRNGRRSREESPLTIFTSQSYKPPREIADRAADMLKVLGNHLDPSMPNAIENYFHEVYWKVGEKELDKKGILKLLSVNARDMSFCYRQIGAAFRLIESPMVPVIIELETDAQQAVENLEKEEIPSGKLARQLQSYVVQVPLQARDALRRAGKGEFKASTHRGDQFFVLTDNKLYDERKGLLWEEAGLLAIEDTIIG